MTNQAQPKTQGKIEAELGEIKKEFADAFADKHGITPGYNSYLEMGTKIKYVWNFIDDVVGKALVAQQNDLIERVIELIGELRPAMGTAEIKSGYYNSALDDIESKISQMGEEI